MILLDISDNVGALQSVLHTAYDAMIRHCSELIGIARGIAGFAALWYIGARIWQRIAADEPVKMVPLLRPFGIGICILLFPSLIGVINGVMQPVADGTANLEAGANKAVAVLMQQKQEALEKSDDWQMYVGPSGSGNLDKWEQLSGEADSGVFSGVSNRLRFEMAKASYSMKNSVKVWLSEILQVLFQSAALCINTIRTFYLIILAIFGPLAFGLSVFDGFGHIIRDWLARYLNVFLWLPVANLFGALIGQIQQEMIRLDITQVQATGQTSFGPTDTAYIVFLILAIAGYFTVPAVTSYIISGGGIGLRKARALLSIQN